MSMISIGDSLGTHVNNGERTIQSRGHTFPCRVRTNDGLFSLLLLSS